MVFVKLQNTQTTILFFLKSKRFSDRLGYNRARAYFTAEPRWGSWLAKKKVEGHKVVLTADRTLMSEYSGGVFLGFSACVPKGLIPDWLYFSMFCPSVPVNEDGSVKYAPCGTRKVEAALLEHG